MLHHFPCTNRTYTAEKEPKEAIISAIFLLTYNNEDTTYLPKLKGKMYQINLTPALLKMLQ